MYIGVLLYSYYITITGWGVLLIYYDYGYSYELYYMEVEVPPCGPPNFQGTTEFSAAMVTLKWIEYGFGFIIIRSPYTPYSIYLRVTVIQQIQSLDHPGS